MLKGIVQEFKEIQDVSAIVAGVEDGLSEQLITGLAGSGRSLYFASLYEQTKRPYIIVTYNLLQAQKLYDDLVQLISDKNVLLYPANELMIADLNIASPELRAQRIATINHLIRFQHGIVIVPISGLRKILPPKEIWKRHLFHWRVDDEIDLDQCKNIFDQMGYVRTDMVTSPGEFSIRGGIIDIYPLTEEDPIRIELFDEIIDSIRTFSAQNQRSKEKRTEVFIGPATEFILEDHHFERMIEHLEGSLAKSLTKIKDEAVKENLALQTEQELELLRERQIPDHVFKYLSFAYEKPASLLDYLPENSVICIDEISRVIEMIESLDKEEATWKTSLLEDGKIVHDAVVSHKLPDLLFKADYPILYFSLFLRSVPGVQPQNIVNISCKPMQNFHGQMHVLKTEMERWKKASFTVIFLAEDEKRMEKLEQVLTDYSMDVVKNESERILPRKAQIMQGNLNSGFEFPLYKLAVINENELFNKKARRKAPRKQSFTNAERIQSYDELKIGDYVVHVNHGIGRYLGVETLEINGVHKDYLKIKYQGNDLLYVPIDQIHLVQKYVSSEGKEPKIYKLGGSEWKRVKKRVESSVQDIAEDLIQLYAERQARPGFAFSPDTELQREFEASFPYKETEDQLRSIEEIKRDMEKPRPMDRLLCGDVGYGKTEVALRAAFKAIMDGKQVAFLVPTTILAQQHYETMRERFQDYPIKIGMLSRFRTRKEQQETIKGLKNGTIDIVVGTHRLLSKDVDFHDLGLLIIDEEQRFGVRHKERIKQLKTNVDVLTLTATPIPRTLHMSLLGVRDLSIIETPPENRFPVQTYVLEYNEYIIKEAIERELARNGQIYYVYNRVEDIERKTQQLSLLVPDARFIYAHGQMAESELENVMISFLQGEYDVLVATTIIETGVDIPNVNTLIVEDADRFGLSQLYQLRGRVGRSNRVAYAYFTYQKDKILTEVAEKRLQAIKEFTELGSGFKIAMRDLAIRGTGNILGPQQHGFIDAVGFDLYNQMLKEAIEKRKGEIPKEEKTVEIDLDVDAYIPESYISDGYQKIEMYKRFRAIKTMEDLTDLQDEMIDRFGDYPEPVALLFSISRIKVHCLISGVELVKREQNEIVILFTEEDSKQVNLQKLDSIYRSFGRIIGFGMEGEKFKISIQIKKYRSVSEWMKVLEQVTEQLPNIVQKEVKTVS